MTDDDTLVPPGYVDNLFDLTGRVAIVTGAASGLGAAIATGFAQLGVHVVIVDSDTAGAQRVCRTINASGGVSEILTLNVTDKKQCASAARDLQQHLGHIDILVNSAGSAHRSPAEDFPEAQFDRIIELNLKGTYIPCQSFGSVMLEQGRGNIINMGSIGSYVAYPWASAYLASKGGVLQLTRALALEWRDRGVRVNAIGPTLMESPLTTNARHSTSVTSDFIEQRMIRKRSGLPRELIGAAVFLASDASQLVTGHMLMCDDGYLSA